MKKGMCKHYFNANFWFVGIFSKLPISVFCSQTCKVHSMENQPKSKLGKGKDKNFEPPMLGIFHYVQGIITPKHLSVSILNFYSS